MLLLPGTDDIAKCFEEVITCSKVGVLSGRALGSVEIPGHKDLAPVGAEYFQSPEE